MDKKISDKDRKRIAVALGYDPGEEAPKIIATGQNLVADKIIERAREANIPLHKDAGLADTLSKLDLDEYIPPELYSVVAEVLLYVDKADKIKEKLQAEDARRRKA